MPHRLRPRRARARGPYHRQDPAARPAVRPREGDRMSTTVIPVATPTGGYDVHVGRGLLGQVRSEERRVGKEWRGRWEEEQKKKEQRKKNKRWRREKCM